jgi:hypothetical protein
MGASVTTLVSILFVQVLIYFHKFEANIIINSFYLFSTFQGTQRQLTTPYNSRVKYNITISHQLWYFQVLFLVGDWNLHGDVFVRNFFLSFFQLYQQGRLCQLGGEFCELEVFAKVLRASDKR